MKYIAITEHRGYMEDPKEFDSKEEAIKYCEENHSLTGGYVIHGDIVWRPKPMKIDRKLLKENLKKLSEISKKREESPHEDAVWKMRGGHEIKMAAMTDDHIMNCIRSVQRGLARMKVLNESAIDSGKYLKLRQYDSLCYHAIKRGLAKEGALKHGK